MMFVYIGNLLTFMLAGIAQYLISEVKIYKNTESFSEGSKNVRHLWKSEY